MNIDEAKVIRLEELCDLAENRRQDSKAAVQAQIEYNTEFHGVILAAAASPRLEEAMKGAAGVPHQFRALFWSLPAQRDRALGHHREIARALRERNPDLAAAAMEVHLVQALHFLESVIASDDSFAARL